jgi:ADP-ribose diphosphatase
MRNWLVERVATLFEHRLFRLERRALVAGEDRREALVLAAPDWTNVVALLPDLGVVLVRQWRFGVQAPTLEIPGGMIDDGEDARQAAERELLEETGYRATEWLLLGSVQPNPAFLSNTCTTWLARGLVRVCDPQGDGEEEIEVETVPLNEIAGLIAGGQIRHSLVISAFHLLGLHGLGASSRPELPSGAPPLAMAGD